MGYTAHRTMNRADSLTLKRHDRKNWIAIFTVAILFFTFWYNNGTAQVKKNTDIIHYTIWACFDKNGMLEKNMKGEYLISTQMDKLNCSKKISITAGEVSSDP